MKHLHTFESFLNEANNKAVTKQDWNRADDEQREKWLSSAIEDPNDIEDLVDAKWEDLPDVAISNMMKESLNEGTFEGFLAEAKLNEVATPRLLKSAGQNLAKQVKNKKNYTVDQLKDRLMSTPVARMLSDDEILIVLDHAKEELGMNESATNEGLSDEAITLHAMLRCGQDSAQNFIDDNRIDPKKLMEYIRVNPDKKIDVKDYICGTSGTVGSNKGLLQRFIKELKK